VQNAAAYLVTVFEGVSIMYVLRLLNWLLVQQVYGALNGLSPLYMAAYHCYFDRSTLLCVRFKELTQVLGD